MGRTERRARRLAALCAVCAIGLGAWALPSGCSSSGDEGDAPGPSYGAGAGAGAGGSTAGPGAGEGASAGSGAAGTDGRDEVPDSTAAGVGGTDPNVGDTSKTEACLEYGAARLARHAECSGMPGPDEEEIERGLQGCPDQYFSDGSTRTVAGLLDCAAQMRTFPCDELIAQRVPPCVTPGTRAGGESCVFLTQCASLRCSGDLTACGTCATPAGPGESCDFIDHICPPNYFCDDLARVCIEAPLAPPTSPSDPPPPTKPTGAECTNHSECTGQDLCFGDVDDVQRCTARVPLGGVCAGSTQYCLDEHYCDPTDDTCKVMPGNGEPCGLHFGEPSYCAEYLQCVRDDPAGPTCRPAPGFECDVAGITCQPGSTCCASPDCATPTCLRGLKPGEACGDPLGRCVHGSACQAGTCQVDDSLTVFAELCGAP